MGITPTRAFDTGLAEASLHNRWEELNLYAKAGSNPGLAFSPKGRVPPTQKLSRIKQRIGFAHWNLKYGKEAS